MVNVWGGGRTYVFQAAWCSSKPCTFSFIKSATFLDDALQPVFIGQAARSHANTPKLGKLESFPRYHLLHMAK